MLSPPRRRLGVQPESRSQNPPSDRRKNFRIPANSSSETDRTAPGAKFSRSQTKTEFTKASIPTSNPHSSTQKPLIFLDKKRRFLIHSLSSSPPIDPQPSKKRIEIAKTPQNPALIPLTHPPAEPVIKPFSAGNLYFRSS